MQELRSSEAHRPVQGGAEALKPALRARLLLEHGHRDREARQAQPGDRHEDEIELPDSEGERDRHDDGEDEQSGQMEESLRPRLSDAVTRGEACCGRIRRRKGEGDDNHVEDDMGVESRDECARNGKPEAERGEEPLAVHAHGLGEQLAQAERALDPHRHGRTVTRYP